MDYFTRDTHHGIIPALAGNTGRFVATFAVGWGSSPLSRGILRWVS